MHWVLFNQASVMVKFWKQITTCRERKSYVQIHVALYTSVAGLMNSTTAFVTTAQIQASQPAKTETTGLEETTNFFCLKTILKLLYKQMA